MACDRFNMSEIVFPYGVRFPTGEVADVYKFSTMGSLNLVLGTCVTYERSDEVLISTNHQDPTCFLLISV